MTHGNYRKPILLKFPVILGGGSNDHLELALSATEHALISPVPFIKTVLPSILQTPNETT